MHIYYSFILADCILSFFVVNKANALECRLKVELQNSKLLSTDECPLYVPNYGTQLLKDYAEQAQSEGIDSDSVVNASAVWDLCLALWGDLDGSQCIAD